MTSMHRLLELGEDALEIVLEASADDRVERAHRLVQEEQLRIEHKRAHDADPLALAAAQLGGVAFEQRRVEAHERGELVETCGHARRVAIRGAARARRDVVDRGEMRGRGRRPE